MPEGAEKVTFKVKVPATDCRGAVLRNNVPRLFVPLSEPTPSAVVPTKLLPVNVNCGTPLMLPVVEPAILTSSALAMLWLAPTITRTLRPSTTDLTNPEITVFIIFDSSSPDHD